MINKGLIGAQNNSDAQITPLRAGRQGELIVSELHGRYAEAVSRGSVFRAATQALVTTTVGLATTYTGLVLSNPLASNKNLEIIQASLMQSVIQATQIEAFALATGSNSSTDVTHTTPVTIANCLVGGTVAGAQGKADVAATLPSAPTYDTFLSNTATATQNSSGLLVFDVGGSIILPPGTFCAFVTPAQASVAGMWFGFKWNEVPV